MPDPLGIIGTISVAAAAANKLITIVSNIQNAPVEVNSLNANVETLLSVLDSTKALFQDARVTDAAKPLIDTVKQCVINCEDAIEPLQELLRPMASGGIRSQSVMVRLLWNWKRDDVMSMKARLTDAMASLSVAVMVLNGFVSGKGQNEIIREMASGFEKLRRDFRHQDSSRALRKTLEDDLETVIAATTVAGDTREEMLDRWVHVQAAGSGNAATGPFELDDREISAILAVDDADRISELLESAVLDFDKSLSSRTILHRCALYDSTGVTTILLEHGALADARDVDRMTPLAVCIKEQSWGVAALVIGHGCSLKPLMTNFFELLDTIDDLSSLRPTLRALADRLKDLEDGPFLVHQAVERNDPRYLSLLLQEGFDANMSEYGCLPIHVAAAMNHAACASVLFQHGADPNAIIPSTAKEFLRRSIPYNRIILDVIANESRFTPLMCCPLHQGTETLKVVLQNGGDPNALFPPINDNFLIPHCAPEFTDASKLALEAGTNPSHQNIEGKSPLFWAVACRNQRLINLLLDHGADPEVKTNRGSGQLTALHKAVEVDNFSAAELLIQRGARLDSRNEANETPLEMAENRRMSDIAQMLRKREALC
ncbi:hypothetical protein CkaCkLH20_05493 [Colletotrichum karsti]|uniref:Fungal N-terminal domain-containing protein n=1 Tax=Colletotrichum karsti TaxID=1095194 RepID=A0A9P6I5C2_9PEZI|nr:uncharacterized protein CkaCkLH20_05493 [Colletotrichum karsti]KAF9877227.1 hypothetical protein CkaCkLH20_05493 [Colletotrichum karsti]